jgi:IS5 family transposase
MQKEQKKPNTMLFHSEEELLGQLVTQDHPYRKVKKLLPLKKIVKPLKELYSEKGAVGIPIKKGFAALLLQWWEDLSDRQMERALQENTAMKWFCGFNLTEKTPDHSYFGKLRKRIGTKNLADLFNEVTIALGKAGLVGGVFTFVDSAGIVSKLALWKERDKAIAEGEEKLNNAVVKKYATDKDARFGCKGKKKYWFGYKRQVAIDMKQGFITKTFAHPANELDFKILPKLLPKEGMILGDKGYSTKENERRIKGRGLHSGIIKKNGNKDKNRDLDRWITKVRMPYENVFAKQRVRARYRGLVKVQFQVMAEALVYNLKRLVKIEGPPLVIAGA